MIVNLKTLRNLALCLIATLSLSACVSSYEQTIEQGNEVSNDAIALLQPGMSKPEVRALLGSPLSSNLFNDDRWEYYYSKAKLSSKQRETSVFSLFFEDERLANIKGAVNWDKVKSLRTQPEKVEAGGTVVTKPTQKKKGLFSGLFKDK